MRAIVLAAGRGSRLGALTDDKPKCMVQLNGRTLFDRCITTLQLAGVQDILVVAGYRSEALRRADTLTRLNPQWETSGIIASLRCADDWLTDSECIVAYSDIFFTPTVVRRLIAAAHDIAVAYDPEALALWSRRMPEPLSDLESFRLGPDSTIAAIGNRPTTSEPLDGQFMGLLKLRPSGWRALIRALDRLPLEDSRRIDTSSLLHLVVKSRLTPIHAVPNDGEWGEVDTPTDLHVYHELYPHV